LVYFSPPKVLHLEDSGTELVRGAKAFNLVHIHFRPQDGNLPPSRSFRPNQHSRHDRHSDQQFGQTKSWLRAHGPDGDECIQVVLSERNKNW
jgi:FMN phosphatase YigB (HAD superfamily)